MRKTFIDEFNGIVAWLDEGTAKEQAMESEWAEIGDKHYCPDCYEFDEKLDEYVPKKKEEAMKELKDLVAGDKVVVYDECNNRRIAIVERITKTLVVVNNIKYRKSNGFKYGVSSFIFSHRIERPKDEEQIKEIELEYRKRIIIHRIHNFNLYDYPLEVLEKFILN